MTLNYPTFSLQGRKALVTGASRGIGQALAQGLAYAGADVAVAARNEQDLQTSLTAIRALGRKGVALSLDVTDLAAIRAGVDAACQQLGGLDILINNAGIEQVCPSLDVDEALWDRILDTNLKGAFFCAQAAARIMTENTGGSIVNVCSLTSEVGVPTATPYGSSKSGLLGMTRALATEWARQRRIRDEKLIDKQAIQFMLADCSTELWAAQLMVYEAARAHDRGTVDLKSLHVRCSMAKLYATEMANRVADRCLQIWGGRGYRRDNAVERFYREVRVDRIWEGSSEIQRMIIAGALAKRGLGGM